MRAKLRRAKDKAQVRHIEQALCFFFMFVVVLTIQPIL
jgi:hypothetical protein